MALFYIVYTPCARVRCPLLIILLISAKVFSLSSIFETCSLRASPGAINGPRSRSIFSKRWATTVPKSVQDESETSSSENKKSKKRRNSSTARSVAIHALANNHKQFSLQVLESTVSSLSDQRDRSFARLLVTVTERRMGQIDNVIAQCTTRAPKQGKTTTRKDDAYIQACLRVGAAQLLFIDIPQYAAVKETVESLRNLPDNCRISDHKIKFVNAILRRISREGAVLLAEHTTPGDNIAPWLMQAWEQDWGHERANILAESFMKQSHTDLSVNYYSESDSTERRRQAQERVRDAFGGDTLILPHGSIRVDTNATAGAVSEWPLYREGAWWVQDASAALPALALYNALSKDGMIEDMHVVDLCAAPGGKTAQLVSMGFGRVTAVEVNARRSRRLTENLERLGMQDRCEVVVANGTEWVPSSDSVTGVIVDVPCSATGTGSKRPDVLRRDDNLDSLMEVQEKLANHCADTILSPGGIMVYATCSVLKQESENQVQKLLDRTGGVKLETLPFTPGEIPGFDDAIDENGWLRVLPGTLPGALSSCDGFFVARLKRIR